MRYNKRREKRVRVEFTLGSAVWQDLMTYAQLKKYDSPNDAARAIVDDAIRTYGAELDAQLKANTAKPAAQPAPKSIVSPTGQLQGVRGRDYWFPGDVGYTERAWLPQPTTPPPAQPAPEDPAPPTEDPEDPDVTRWKALFRHKEGTGFSDEPDLSEEFDLLTQNLERFYDMSKLESEVYNND